MHQARFLTLAEVRDITTTVALNNAERFFPMVNRQELANMFLRLERDTGLSWYAIFLAVARATDQLGRVFTDIKTGQLRELEGVLIIPNNNEDIVIPLKSKFSVNMFDHWQSKYLPITPTIFDNISEHEYDA